MQEEKHSTSAKENKQKPDISKLLAIIPSAAELRGGKKTLAEKRIRIRYDRSFSKPIAKIPVHVASELDIKPGDQVEIVVAGKRKVTLTADLYETKENTVIVHPAELEKQGVADNSIATIRKVKASS
ncbi:MAG: hypothetical protein QXE81_05570 [Desulfurococcaceae archaeon]